MLGSVIILWRTSRFPFCQQSRWLDSGCKSRLSSSVWRVHTSAQLTGPLLRWSGRSHTCAVHSEPETRVVWDPEAGNPSSSFLHSGYSTPFQLPKASFTGSSTKKDEVSITFSAVCPDVLLSEWAPPRGNSTRYRGFTSICCHLCILLPFISCLLLFL